MVHCKEVAKVKITFDSLETRAPSIPAAAASGAVSGNSNFVVCWKKWPPLKLKPE